MMTDIIAWILSWGAEEIQAAMAVVGTLIGSVIAFFGWRISRHSAYGARPVSVVAMKVVTWDEKDAHEMSCEIEIWNMQKYPIVIRNCVFTAERLSFEKLPPIHDLDGETWHRLGHTIVRNSEKPAVIAPDARFTIKPTARFKWRRSEPFKENVKWTVTYFDPQCSKERSLHGRDVFDYTFLHRQGL